MNLKNLITVTTLAATALSTTSCRSTLYRAAERGDLQTVQQELNAGAQPDGKAPKSNLLWQIPTSMVAAPLDVVRTVAMFTYIWTVFDPLYYVDDKGVAKISRDKYLCAGIFSFNGKTAAEVAEANKHMDIVKELFLAGGDVSKWSKARIVSDAARQGDAVTLSKLLQRGVNPDWYCTGDYSPLMLAIGGGHEECARLLLSKGADFYSPVTINGADVSCYDYAAAKGKVGLYKKLGGSMEFAPSSIQGYTINLDYSRAHHDMCGTIGPKSEFIDCEPDETYDARARRRGVEKTTFLAGGKTNDDVYKKYKYTKISANKARIDLYFEINSGEWQKDAAWELTFTSPTRAKVRTWDGGGGDIDTWFYSNLTATINKTSR